MQPFIVVEDVGDYGPCCGVCDQVVFVYVWYGYVFVFVVDVALGEMVRAGDGVFIGKGLILY